MEHEHITTRCPGCGHQTIIMGSGGHLVCSWISCRKPGLINDGPEIQADIIEYGWAKKDYDGHKHESKDHFGQQRRLDRLIAVEKRLQNWAFPS